MARPLAPGLLVSIPHSGLLCPPEVAPESLAKHRAALFDSTDWFTDEIYDFSDLLDSKAFVFRYSQIFINVNRHPEYIDEAIPVAVDSLPVYAESARPDLATRRRMLRRHHLTYHRRIAAADKVFVLDGHSTSPGLLDAGGVQVSDDIILSDRQESPLDPPGGICTAPDGFLQAYAEELDRVLWRSRVRIGLNTTYLGTYGHVMARHGWDGSGPRERRAPLLLQETGEHLYMSKGVPDPCAIETLRRCFAEALSLMLRRVARFRVVPRRTTD